MIKVLQVRRHRDALDPVGHGAGLDKDQIGALLNGFVDDAGLQHGGARSGGDAEIIPCEPLEPGLRGELCDQLRKPGIDGVGDAHSLDAAAPEGDDVNGGGSGVGGVSGARALVAARNPLSEVAAAWWLEPVPPDGSQELPVE